MIQARRGGGGGIVGMGPGTAPMPTIPIRFWFGIICPCGRYKANTRMVPGRR